MTDPIMMFSDQWIDKRCYFCHSKFTKQDASKPGYILVSTLDHAAHQDCLEFIIQKHPMVPISKLENSISRVRVDLSNVRRV